MEERTPILSLTKKDFDVTWFSGSGAGGQYRNKHQNCCRIIHRESGAMGVGQRERSRQSNQKDAMENMVKSDKFQLWLRMKIASLSIDEAEIENKVEKALKKVKVERYTNNRWEEWKDEEEDGICKQ